MSIRSRLKDKKAAHPRNRNRGKTEEEELVKTRDDDRKNHA